MRDPRTIALLIGLGSIGLGARSSSAYTIEGLDGPPTANELASLKAGLKFDYKAAAMTCSGPPCGPFNIFLGNHGNNYVYGQSGGAVEGMIALYQVTKDREVLDSMVYFADQMLAHRNDRYKTHDMYTGKPELCWPNKDPGPEYGYCGTEQGDVLGHITSVALEIVKSPSVWDKTTPVPDALHFGPTYLERAHGYLTDCSKTIDTFIIPQLVDGNSRFRWPDSAAFAALGSRYAGNRGKTVPWNQNTMLANGFLSIATALGVLGEETATVTRYDAIVKTWVRALIDGGVVKGMVMGNPTYDWCYGSADKPPGCSEDVGHGGYDFWGVYRAFARPKLGFTMAEVVPFANTFRYLIMKGGSFSSKVDGSGTGGNVGSTWLYAAFFRHDIFQAVATPLIGAAKGGDPDTAGRILWSKYMNSRSWQPEETYGDVPVVPPGSPDAAAGPSGDTEDGGSTIDSLAAGTGGTGAVATPDAGGGAATGGRSAAGGGGGAGAGATGGAGGNDDTGSSNPRRSRAGRGGCQVGDGEASGWGWVMLGGAIMFVLCPLRSDRPKGR
jgi:hypothetical protein